ncbi:hypothetical protein PTKIN_Ptkin11bG0139300 [Pterospermum kingtungense]
MEKHRKKFSSGDKFSFPRTPTQDQDSDFEFGCFTPDSPSQDPYKSSPADYLFFNGRFLPHAFPLQPSTMIAAEHISRGTSRTNSINSKDTLMSSRRNSTSSRSSCSSSARTSLSDSSERRLLYHSKIHACNYNKASKTVTAQLYGDSQRWQYITAMPVLKREISRKKNSGVTVKDTLRAKKQGDLRQERSNTRRKSGPCLRLFRLFLLVCRQCHAMEPSRKQDVVQGNLNK